MRGIEQRVLILAVVSTALAVARVAPVPAAPKNLTAQLGFILFCKTSMSDVTARLGSGTRFTDIFFVWRGWYDPTAPLLQLAGAKQCRHASSGVSQPDSVRPSQWSEGETGPAEILGFQARVIQVTVLPFLTGQHRLEHQRTALRAAGLSTSYQEVDTSSKCRDL